MKLNVFTAKKRFLIDVNQSYSIWEVKEVIAKVLNLSISPCNNVEDDVYRKKDYIHLYLNNIPLHNDCTVDEIGLKSGATIRSKQVHQKPYTLKVLVPCLSREITLTDEVSIIETKIGDLRSLLQNRLGLPVSTFRLQKKHDKRLLFDNHSLSYYDINSGDTLALEVWDETKDIIMAAISGDISHTISKIPSYSTMPSLNRYCLRVVLFIAAHMDEVNLATEVLQRGVRCYDAVSEHPCRQWCVQQSHTDVFKAPVHQAALQGTFKTLSMFLRHSPTCVVARDGNGLTPSTYAMKNNHLDCWKLLTVAHFQFQNVYGLSLVTYSKLLKWCDRAKDRLSFYKAENRKRMRHVDNKFCSIGNSRLGEPIVINGFHDKLEDTEKQNSPKWLYRARPKSMPNPERKHLLSTHSDSLSKSVMSHSVYLSRVNIASVDVPICQASSVSSQAKSYRSNAGRKKHMSSRHEARLEARKIILQQTGRNASEIASECFEMGQTFHNMKWSSQMKLALKCSLNRIDDKRLPYV